MDDPITVGVIADTHGLLRPQAVEALAGSALIIHAGDVGGADVLPRLRDIAPTVAVRGNVDTGAWARSLPATRVVDIGGKTIYVLHALSDLDLDPAAAGFAAVVSGHTHRPEAEVRNGVLYLNPGSAGPRRFSLPVAVARLQIGVRDLSPQILELQV